MKILIKNGTFFKFDLPSVYITYMLYTVLHAMWIYHSYTKSASFSHKKVLSL